MTEWYEPYRNATEREAIAQALDACSRKDCAHCLYQGKGIKCAQRLLEDAAKAMAVESMLTETSAATQPTSAAKRPDA